MRRDLERRLQRLEIAGAGSSALEIWVAQCDGTLCGPHGERGSFRNHLLKELEALAQKAAPGLWVTPVTFPPGCARLATSPRSTGSALPAMTIGIVVVAFFAPTAVGVPTKMRHLVAFDAREPPCGSEPGRPIG
jgi:hypothetical protein